MSMNNKLNTSSSFKTANNKFFKLLKKLDFRFYLVIVVLFIFVFVILKDNLPTIVFNSMTKEEFYYVKDDNLYNNRHDKIAENIYDVSFAESENLEVQEVDLKGISSFNFSPIYDESKKIAINFKNYDIGSKKVDIDIKSIGNDTINMIIKNVDMNFVKVDKDITHIVYIKNDDNEKKLYINDFKDEILICNKVNEFYADDDLQNIYFIDDNDLVCYKNLMSKKIISTNSEIIIERNDIPFDDIYRLHNFSYIYVGKYQDDDRRTKDIYKLYADGFMDLVASDLIGSPIVYYLDDYAYFYKEEKESLRVSDYVIDDISDGSFESTKPNLQNYRRGFFGIPDYFSYYSDVASYNQVANFINQNKDTVDKYIEQIKRGTFNNNYNNLYCYDGNSVFLICKDKVKSVKRVKGQKPYIFFEAYMNDSKTPEKIALTDIIRKNLSINNYMKTIRSNTSTNKYLYHKAVGMKINNVNEGDFEVYRLKDKFVIKLTSGANQFVYSVTQSFGEIVDANLVGSHMTNEIKIFASPYIKDIVYSVMNSRVNAYLFVNGKRVEEKIMNDYIVLSNDLKTVIYFVDYDSNNFTGKLKLLKDDKTKLIEENVVVTSVKTNASNGQIYFINNFNKLTLSGDFYKYDDYNQKRLVSSNVMSIINNHIYDEQLNIAKIIDTTNYNDVITTDDLNNNMQSF